MSENFNSQIDLASRQREKRILWMATIPISILMNFAGGTLTMYLKLPIYLDTMGTVMATILAGIPAGITTGIASSLLGGLLENPVIPYYTGTQIAIAIFVGMMAKKGFFRSILKVIITGISLGIVSAIVSAPVVMFFRGFTGTCTDVTAIALLASGQSIFTSVFLSNFANEPLDKTLQCLMVFWLIKSLPRNFINRFAPIGYLKWNG